MTEQSELADALVRIHAKLKNPAFDSVNPHFKNGYTSLAGARNAIVELAASEGVVVIQDLVTDERGVGCKTILLHKSGQERVCGPLFLPASKADPQGFGSCATYARRYSLLAAFNLVGDEDDDANAGQESHKKQNTSPPPRKAESTPVAEKEAPPDNDLPPVGSLMAYINGCRNRDQLTNALDRIKDLPAKDRAKHTLATWDRWKLMLGNDVAALEELLTIVTSNQAASQKTKDTYTADIAALMRRAKEQATFDQAEELFGGSEAA